MLFCVVGMIAAMYAIAFDLVIDKLKASYPGPSYNNGYGEIRKILAAYGFKHQQGSVYFGDETVDAVNVVLAIMDVTSQLPWFASSVDDVRMLRIEDNNDLMPAVQRASRVATASARPTPPTGPHP